MNRIACMIALLLVMAGQAWGATKYGFSVGDVAVTSDNCGNITKTGVITLRSGGHLYYSPSSNTLYVKNATIWCTGSGKRGIYNESCAGLTIVFEGADTIYAKSGEALRVNKNTTITCRNGGTAFIEGESKNGLCPYSGSTVTVNDADLVVRGPESSAIEGGGSGSSGGSIVINNSTVKAWGKKAAVYNMKSVTVKGNSEVRLTMRTSNVTVQNVATFNVEVPMAVTYPDNAFFDSKKKTLCSIDYPDGIKSTILILKDAIEINATNFPDANFRSYVSSNFDNNSDGYLNYAERNSVGLIILKNLSISTMKGVEHFKNLTSLQFLSCNLNSLDVSKNTALKALACLASNLTSLDVSNNKELELLGLTKNRLQSLDVSKNTKLTELQCEHNLLTSLTISASNTALKKIAVFDNKLRGSAMQTFINNLPRVTDGELEIISTQDLETIYGNMVYVDQVNTAKSKGWKVYQYENTYGILGLFPGISRGIEINSTNFPDNNFRSWVSSNCDIDKDGYLGQQETAVKTIIEVSSKNISSLKGIEYFNELTTLRCDNNSLISLDLSKNTALTTLECANCGLNSLDLSENTALTDLSCRRNNLTELDLSNNKALNRIQVHINKIKGAKMDALVASLPKNTTTPLYKLYVYFTDPDEGNFFTQAQAKAAKARGWQPYWYSGNNAPWATYEGSKLGDVNGDGKINSADVQRVYSIMASGATGTTNPEADLNNDGEINSADIQRLYAIMATQ